MKMAAEEFKQFLSIRPIASRRYIEVLKTLVKPSTWSELKRALRTVANVSDKQLSSFLKELVDYGFVEKKNKLYMIADPLLAEAARRGGGPIDAFHNLEILLLTCPDLLVTLTCV
jgi:hypothetical protein